MMGIHHTQIGRKRSPFLLLPLACLTAVAASVLHAHAVPESVAAVKLEASSTAGEQVLVSSEATNEATSKKNPQDGDQTDNPCGIWLAPSTIKGAGLGMFAGKDFQAEDSLLPTGDSVIGIVDISLHNGDRHREAFLWDEYTWSGSALRLDKEGYDTVNVASAGFGAAVNCFLPILNTDEYTPELQWNGLQSSQDPGAGASTSFHARMSVAQRPISAGEEFFVTYGEEWFKSRTHLGPIPLLDDLNHASALLERFSKLSIQNSTILADLWDTFVKDNPFNGISRTLGAFRLDESPFDLSEKYGNNMTTARIDDSKRNLEWLQQHGTCGDHIVAGRSTIRQAGHGAFASRKLPKDTVVAQLPMIHITNRSRLDMYHFALQNHTKVVDTSRGVAGQQLLLNYCYGHGESSLLLCPYGPMTNYINHNQSNANVRLQWGRPETGNHMPELLNKTVKEIETSSASTGKLAMELLATRDIEAGEEIIMDYGDEWEAAWNAHVASWEPPRNGYKTAVELNADTNSRLRTVFEEHTEQHYPDGVRLYCDTGIEKSTEWKESYESGKLEEYLWKTDAAWWPCEILGVKTADNGDVLYTTHMFEVDEKTGGEEAKNSILVRDVPRAVFHFIDKPYMSDTFLPNAFRHDIRIPDELFPAAWRNLKKE